MWKYIAGLFDGDGNFVITKHSYKNQTPTIEIRGIITGGSKNQFFPIRDFLGKNEIFVGVSRANKGKDEKGFRQYTSYHFYIGSNDGLKKFCEMIYPHLIFKKEQCKIILRAIELKEEIKRRGEFIKDNLPLFDQLRHELHKYSRKGPRKLKPWK